jgi:hypothetical protein
MDAGQLKLKLSQYYGGGEIYRHSLVATFNYTEGARAFFRDAGGGAYWLADILATEPQIRAGVMKDGFCVAVLNVIDTKATITVARDMDSEGNFDSVHYSREIDFTDCPAGEWKFYLTYTTTQYGNVIMAMLPKEY